MAGTIYSGSYLNGIVLGDPTTQLPATVTGSVSNKNADAIYGKPVARWTVANQGTIQSTGSTGYGIDLRAGGTVANGPSGAAAALIAGYGGVLIRGALATVGNLGTISGTGKARDGVELKAGGQVTNGSTAVSTAQISGGRHAVVIRSAPGTVTNFGTLANSGTYGVADLFAGGSLTNGSSASSTALIEGSGNGVYIAGGAGTVTNFATIDGGWGVVLHTGGTVVNKSGGTISATTGNGVTIAKATGTVTNLGTIQGDIGVDLQAGGLVANGSAAVTAASISGGRRAVTIRADAGTVTNFGTLTNSGTLGVADLLAGGSLTNGSSASSKALIEGSGNGVYIAGGAGTVTNFGAIDGGWGVVLHAGGKAVNEAGASITATTGAGVNIAQTRGTVTNLGTITSNFGTITYYANFGPRFPVQHTQYGIVLRAGGSVINGSSDSTSALINGSGGVRYIYYAMGYQYQFDLGVRGAIAVRGNAGTVTNFGTISADLYGVNLFAGGTVTNGSAISTKALIEGKGIEISGAAGTVTNFGTIEGAIDGLFLDDGGRVANGSASSTAAHMNEILIAGAAGTVTNFGTIAERYGDGVRLLAGGRITNGSSSVTKALISGGILIDGSTGTVTNFGTITSSSGVDAVSLKAISHVTNGSDASTKALISGNRGDGIRINSTTAGAGTVSNFGTIEGTGARPLISLPRPDANGVEVDAHGTVINGSRSSTAANIRGAGAGVYLADGGTVTNFGTIVGNDEGVFSLSSSLTLTNFGEIASTAGVSGIAVQMSGEIDNKLVVEPGAVFVGKVLGGNLGGENPEIDFVGSGAADMTNVAEFATIGLSDGRHHTLTLTSANFAGVGGSVITVDDGNSGNTVTAPGLTAADAIIVHAGAGLDKLTGGRGNDVFYAGGDTVMTGNAGGNEFIFSAPGGNTVGDFAVSASNEIVFSDKGFSLGLSGATATPKALPTDLFVENSNGHFTGTSQNFAYATGTGDLFYSASGSSGTPTLVSHFTNAPSLAATQLFFIT